MTVAMPRILGAVSFIALLLFLGNHCRKNNAFLLRTISTHKYVYQVSRDLGHECTRCDLGQSIFPSPLYVLIAFTHRLFSVAIELRGCKMRPDEAKPDKVRGQLRLGCGHHQPAATVAAALAVLLAPVIVEPAEIVLVEFG